MMINVDNVIKAINICLGHGECKDCAYHSTGYSDQNCRGRMLRDILSLLKWYNTQIQYRDDHIVEYEKEINSLNALLENQTKEIPTAPKNEVFWCLCGVCDQLVERSDNYCRHCGQKVKWK